MTSKSILTYLCLSILFLSACKTTKLNKKQADDYIHELADGILLVRLQTGEKKSASLQELGQQEEAKRTLEIQKKQNEQIIAAFKKSYDFSPVYFFYAPDSRLVREKNLDGILLDDEKKNISIPNLKDKPIFGAEFGTIISEDAQAGVNALLILDENLLQLKDPFPFATLTNLFPKEEMEMRAVTKLNQRLHAFLSKASYREQKRILKQKRRDWKKNKPSQGFSSGS